MNEVRPCPECAQGKHLNCTEQMLDEDDEWVPCPCFEAGHVPLESV